MDATRQNSNGAAEERFFYHCFPRRHRNGEESEIGCRILELIRDHGLLLTPEVIKFKYPHANGEPDREAQFLQRRACFTELAPSELPQHADKFGHFALEFEIDTLRGVGAMPVFYIPVGTHEGAGPVSSLGQTLAIQLMDAMLLVQRMAVVDRFIKSNVLGGSRQNFEFGFIGKTKHFSLEINETARSLDAVSYALTPFSMLSPGLEATLNLFYPTDDTRMGGAGSQQSILKYYRQREWRLVANIACKGKSSTQSVDVDLQHELLLLDPDFFGAKLPCDERTVVNPSAANRPEETGCLAKLCQVYTPIDGKGMIAKVRRVVVPSQEDVERVQMIFGRCDARPEVVPIDAVGRGVYAGGRPVNAG